MADGTWMARNQLLKPVQVSQTDWTTAQDRGTVLVSLLYPNVLGNQESLVLRTLRMYAFYRITPVFRVQINATVFHQGQLICAFDPFDMANGNLYSTSAYYLTGLPNVKIMASFSDAIELKIPFIHPRSYLTTNSSEAYNTLGRFKIAVLNPLRAAEGASSTLSVTTWIYGISAQVHVPIQDHDPILNLPNLTVEEFEITSLLTNLTDSATGLINQGKSILTKSTDIVGNLATGNIGQALRKGQGLIDDLGNIFGFDYPSRTLNPAKTITPIENLANSKGISQSQRLALDPFSLHSLHDEVASETIESMNLKKLLQTPMLLTQFTFASTNARGDNLKTIYVNPCVSPVILPAENGVQRTYLSYISNGFTYWNGGIVYDIEIVATKFHSGKLLFAYVPNVKEAPTYTSASDSLPNIIVDIQQTSSVRFTVPYTSSTSMKDTLIFEDDEFIDACTGVLVCYVQNTLAFASNVSPSIEVNIYVSGAPDFNLYVPQRPCWNHDPVESFEATSLVLDTNKNQNVNDTGPILSLNQGLTHSRLAFGEDYTLLDLLKRFSPSIPLAVSTTSPATYTVSPTRYNSYLQYWSRLYNCWCGSMRYKFLCRSSRTSLNSLNVTHVINGVGLNQISRSDWDKGFWGYAMVRTQLAQDCGVEVETPYYSKYNMLVNTEAVKADTSELTSNGTIVLTTTSPETTQSDVYIDFYIAAGDDFRLIYPRPPPLDHSKILSVSIL